MRKRTVTAMASHTRAAIDNLKNDEDEMLRGELSLKTSRTHIQYLVVYVAV